jgi:hypothetical protein
MAIQASLSKNVRAYSKKTKAKRAGGVAQVVESLPNECEALIQTLILPKKNQNKMTELMHRKRPKNIFEILTSTANVYI